jgi:hypothetical protein
MHVHVVKVVGVRFAIMGVTDDELVEVMAPPTERRLDNAVQVTQGDVSTDQDMWFGVSRSTRRVKSLLVNPGTKSIAFRT